MTKKKIVSLVEKLFYSMILWGIGLGLIAGAFVGSEEKIMMVVFTAIVVLIVYGLIRGRNQ